MAKTDKIIFRVEPGKNDFYRMKAAELGYKNISELVTAALEDFEGKHIDPVREMHRLLVELERFKIALREVEGKDYEVQKLQEALKISINCFKELPFYSEAYMRDFETLNY